ncbi:glycosyltransferase [Plastoroseomonas arctica]|uniref:Glycosyltransferase n=1 Tax=Plastoroseomonas arctica TaxID=1509237 RepID=A0AAF1K1A2_9PROT|nr:glycosyltransferase [Plastoroseomonas arctica]MBR0654500.1 glycosyltransferase [Plastoroseomonas arctica]
MNHAPLSVLHLTATEAGGAGRAARRIADSLRALGHDSTLVTADAEPGPDAIAVTPRPASEAQKSARRFLGEFLDQKYLDRLRDKRRSNTLFSAGLDAPSLAELPLLRGADIIHAHFLPGIATPNALRELLALGKPVVWTQHDQWGFTGGCHYSDGCRGFETLCTQCPQLRRDPWGLAALLQAEKSACFAEGLLHLVSPSAWMDAALRASSVFRGAPSSVIRNPIDLGLFRPLGDEQRHGLRARMGIGAGDVVVIAGAISQAEIRKGFDLLLDGLRGHPANTAPGAAPRLWLLSFGHNPREIDLPGIESLALGPIEDDAALAAILGLGDLLILPSREDNYPNIMVEALACGTPVAGFARGGLAELVRDGVSGLLMGEAPDAAAITALLGRIMAAPGVLAGMRDAARAAVAPSHGLVPIGMAYEALYKSLLPLSRVRRATVSVSGDPLIPVARLVRAWAAGPMTRLGPALTEGTLAWPMQAALDDFRATELDMPSADGFIAEHTALAIPTVLLDGIIADAQACRARFDPEAALLAAEAVAVVADRVPAPPAPPSPARAAGPPPAAMFFGTVLLTTAHDHAPGTRLRVTLRSEDGMLPAEGWSAASGGESLPCQARPEGAALVVEFARPAASPAGTHIDILPPAVQGFARRDQMRILALPITEAPDADVPLPLVLTALMAEGWDGFYHPEFANGRWVRWMSPVGHLALPRWAGEAQLVIEGFKRPALFAERRVSLQMARQPIDYVFEQQPGTPEQQAESLWRLHARLPPPPPDRPPVLTLRAEIDLPRTPGDARTITVLLAQARIEPIPAPASGAWAP